MSFSQDLILPLLTWLGFICLVVLFVFMYRWARKQKGAAFAVGMFIQMFLPDPKVQQTIECVVEAKQKEKKPSAGTKVSKNRNTK